jgi:hypothetical protein
MHILSLLKKRCRFWHKCKIDDVCCILGEYNTPFLDIVLSNNSINSEYR